MKNKCSSSFACDKRTLTFLLLLAFVLLVVLMPDLPRQEMPFAPYQTAKTYRKAKSTHENKNKSMFALYRIINKHEISKFIPSLHINRSTLCLHTFFFFISSLIFPSVATTITPMNRVWFALRWSLLWDQGNFTPLPLLSVLLPTYCHEMLIIDVMYLQDSGRYMLKCINNIKYVTKNLNLQMVILFLSKLNRNNNMSWM